MLGPVSPDAVLDHIVPGTDLVVPLANGEPVAVLDAIEAAAEHLRGVRVHQMHSLRDRPYLDGRYGDRLRHRSYFLSDVTRKYFHEGGLDLVPAHFSEMPMLLEREIRQPLVIARASRPDRHGYFTLGMNADYVSSFIGRWPFFLEVVDDMPRTHGRNVLHESQVVGWCESDAPLIEVPPRKPDQIDEIIADFIAERIPNGATIQTGIGAIPNAVLAKLANHRELGVHTELLSDGWVPLIEAGAVTGTRKARRPNKHVATFALGTRSLYDFVDENPSVEFVNVDWVNDARVIATERRFVSINATTEVDLLGQCASETIGGKYWSGSGGQADFARGAMYSPEGQAFVTLRSTAAGGTISRITPRLTYGSVVTTLKNTVDKVVTEWGVAELRARSLSERALALIAVAHPDHRDQLTAEARELGYI